MPTDPPRLPGPKSILTFSTLSPTIYADADADADACIDPTQPHPLSTPIDTTPAAKRTGA